MEVAVGQREQLTILTNYIGLIQGAICNRLLDIKWVTSSMRIP